jgi:hypothetical protein
MNFFKQLLLNAFLLIIVSVSCAQTYNTTQYYGKMNYVFSNVNKSQITTGMLKDYSIEFLNLANYTGQQLHDSNYVSNKEWISIYTGLYSSQVRVVNSLPRLDSGIKLPGFAN